MLREICFIAVDEVVVLRFANRLLSEYQIPHNFENIYTWERTLFRRVACVCSINSNTHMKEKYLWMRFATTGAAFVSIFCTLSFQRSDVSVQIETELFCVSAVVSKEEKTSSAFFSLYRLGCLSSAQLHDAIFFADDCVPANASKTYSNRFKSVVYAE